MDTKEEDDEPLVLSSSALDALKEFYAERDAHAERFAQLQERAEDEAANRPASAAAAVPSPLSMDVFAEDWNASQFWYADATAALLARNLVAGARVRDTIAVVSAPSVFVALKNAVASLPASAPRPRLVLLEYDTRFAVFPEFVPYDFAKPVRLPAELKGTATRIICDPPFLSDDCQTKAALTVRWLAGSSARVVVCTGERMADLVSRLYRAFGVRTTNYEPAHARGLSNEFYCYANFESDDWTWREDGAVAAAAASATGTPAGNAV